MAILHHALGIPGLVIILVVFWGWLPIFLIVWIVRRTRRGKRDPDEEQGPRPARGWMGPSYVDPAAAAAEWDKNSRGEVEGERTMEAATMERNKKNKKVDNEHQLYDRQQQNDEHEYLGYDDRRHNHVEEDMNTIRKNKSQKEMGRDRRHRYENNVQPRNGEAIGKGKGKGKGKEHYRPRDSFTEQTGLKRPEETRTYESRRQRRLNEGNQRYR